MNGNEKKGYFFVFLTGVFFSAEVIGFKEIFRVTNLPPEIAALFGVGGCFLFLLPFFIANKKRRENTILTFKRDGRILILGTISNAVGIVLYYQALKKSDLGPSAILIKTTVLYNVMLGYFLLGERLRPIEVFGICLAIFGIYQISSLEGQISFLSSAYILLSAFFFAIQSFLIKKYVPNILGIEYAFLRLFLLTIFFTFYSILISSFRIPDYSIILTLASFSFLGYFLGRAFYFEAHNYLTISKLNATLLIEPIFLLFIGIIFFSEPGDLRKIFGGGLILLGLYLIVFYRPKVKSQ